MFTDPCRGSYLSCLKYSEIYEVIFASFSSIVLVLLDNMQRMTRINIKFRIICALDGCNFLLIVLNKINI